MTDGDGFPVFEPFELRECEATPGLTLYLSWASAMPPSVSDVNAIPTNATCFLGMPQSPLPVWRD